MNSIPFRVRVSISLTAGLLIVVHLVLPELEIDGITIGLGILGLLPWLFPIVESAKFPGGWEIKFRDLEEAGHLIVPTDKANIPESTASSIPPLAESDPNLALVAIRIEIERRMRMLAQGRGLNSRQPLIRLIRDLRQREVLTHEVLGGLDEIIQAGNQAAHGAMVEPTVAGWAISYGPSILAALDELVDNSEDNDDK